MGSDEDQRTLLAQARQHVADFPSRGGIQLRGRFVHEQQPRVQRVSAGQEHALAFPV